MAGNPKPNILSESIGLRIKKLCAKNYNSKSDCARAFGIKPQNWGRIESGKMKFDPDEIYRFAAFFGVDPGWLLTGRDVSGVGSPQNQAEKPEGAPATRLRLPPVADIPGPKGRRVTFKGDEIPTRGLAAADDSGGTRVPDTDDFGEPIPFPSGLIGVPVVGDSMSPVVLSGQYVEIDVDREGFEKDDGIYVVSVLEPEPQDERPEPLVGTFVKRCERYEDMLYLKSINTYSPFSVYIEHCRIWPVLGVWFGDKGIPPKGY